MTERLPSPPDAPRPKRRHPNAVEAGRPHTFTRKVAKGQRGGQPGWLNGIETGRRQCVVCGVEEVNNFIMADHAGFGDEGKRLLEGKPTVDKYTYIDAKGNQMTSMVPLGCPTFMLDHKGTTMENKERLRRVDDRVDGVDDRVDANEDRIAALEAQNAQLRDFIENRMVEAIHTIVEQQVTARLEAQTVEVVELPSPDRVEEAVVIDAEVVEIEAEVVEEESER